MNEDNRITFSDGNFTINVQPQISVKEIVDKFNALEEKFQLLAKMVAHHHAILNASEAPSEKA
jgi:hypothetical protein